MNVRNPIANQLGFQACWWLCAAGANRGAVIALSLVLLHLYFHPRRRQELAIVLLCGACGIAADAMLVGLGLLAFDQAAALPFWLPVLWMAFAATLNQSLSFLRKRLGLAAVLGAIAGPFSYWIGMKLGRLSFPISEVSAIVALGLVWSLLLPAQMLIVSKIDRRLRYAT